MMNRVISKDGTSIAYERLGRGPAVIMVTGGLDDGSENAPLARELAKHFTVYNYARRGRGDSGDTLPYAVERENRGHRGAHYQRRGQGTPVRGVVGWCTGARSGDGGHRG